MWINTLKHYSIFQKARALKSGESVLNAKGAVNLLCDLRKSLNFSKLLWPKASKSFPGKLGNEAWWADVPDTWLMFNHGHYITPNL